MHIVVASNPAARFGRAGEAGARVAERVRDLGHEVEAIVLDSWAAQLERTRHAMITADALVVVGGDGMVHLGVNIVGGTSKPLVVVPAGSGNDFARATGGDSFAAALGALPETLTSEPVALDLVRIEHPDGVALAAGMVSVGFDADVNVRSFSLQRVPSALRYRAAILATVLRPRHRTFRISIDGGTARTWRTLIAAVANNATAGGGIPLVPDASMTDGLLSIVLADELSYPAFLRLLPKALRGTHVQDPRVSTSTAVEVRLECDDPTVLACADGEIIGRLPVRCTVMPEALRLLRRP